MILEWGSAIRFCICVCYSCSSKAMFEGAVACIQVGGCCSSPGEEGDVKIMSSLLYLCLNVCKLFEYILGSHIKLICSMRVGIIFALFTTYP